MKPHFGVKLAESYFPSMRWIGANPKSDGAVSLSAQELSAFERE
jgi:hypothetical protein